MRTYKCLAASEWKDKNYRVVPIRSEDRHSVREWRNEQMEILRQDKPLTAEAQDRYFAEVVSVLFENYQPRQLLFSILLNEDLIGYGGLVHIDWQSRNAEVSFLTETSRNIGQAFQEDLTSFLSIMKKIAFEELSFHKIHTTVYNIRPAYIKCIESFGFVEEGRLREHVYVRDELQDVLIYSLFNQKK